MKNIPKLRISIVLSAMQNKEVKSNSPHISRRSSSKIWSSMGVVGSSGTAGGHAGNWNRDGGYGGAANEDVGLW